MHDRRYYINIWKELADDKSMLFVAGSRQAGKTTLSKLISTDGNRILIAPAYQWLSQWP